MTSLDGIAILVYFLGALLLNLFMYMVACFHRRKLESRIPTWGFIVSMGALAAGIGGLFITVLTLRRYTIELSALISGLATLINGIVLYLSMKKKHK